MRVLFARRTGIRTPLRVGEERAVRTTVTTIAGAQVTSPAPRAVWRDLAERDEHALVTQTPTWLDAICDTWRFEDASRLYQFDTGLQIVVPSARPRGWPARRIAEESWPRWGLGGAVVSGGVGGEGKGTRGFF